MAFQSNICVLSYPTDLWNVASPRKYNALPKKIQYLFATMQAQGHHFVLTDSVSSCQNAHNKTKLPENISPQEKICRIYTKLWEHKWKHKYYSEITNISEFVLETSALLYWFCLDEIWALTGTLSNHYSH